MNDSTHIRQFDQALAALKKARPRPQNSLLSGGGDEFEILTKVGGLLLNTAITKAKDWAPKIHKINQSIHDRPWQAMAVSAGCGLFSGFLLSKAVANRKQRVS
jgi:hypothetical protein